MPMSQGTKGAKAKAERQLDQALEQTFPASDPVSIGDVTGAGPPKIVSEVMRSDVANMAPAADAQRGIWCFEDDRLDEVVRRMSKLRIVQMPVVDRDDKKLIGIVALRDLAALKVAGAEEALRSMPRTSD